MITPIRKLERVLDAELLRTRIVLRTMKLRALVLVFAAMFALLGFAMLFVAVFTVLSEAYGPAMGALLVAGVAFLILLVLVLVGFLVGRQKRRLADQAARAAREDALHDIEAVEEFVQGLGRQTAKGRSPRTKNLALAALGFGLMVGLISRRRRR